MTSTQRQARYRAKLRERGAVPVTVIVPDHVVADLQLAAEALRVASHLCLGPLRDPVSGRFVSAKSVLR